MQVSLPLTVVAVAICAPPSGAMSEQNGGTIAVVKPSAGQNNAMMFAMDGMLSLYVGLVSSVDDNVS